MISQNELFSFLKKNKLSFFVGVPDSLQKPLEKGLMKMKKKHIVAANEGNAVAIASGYYLSTKKLPVIYMQNSGLGNAINPLTSIASRDVYSVPMLILIGWRGSPNSKDEPQHMLMGKITKNLLKLLRIKYCELNNLSDLKKLKTMINYSKKNKIAVACLIKKNTLKKIPKNKTLKKRRKNMRFDFLKKILSKSSHSFKFFTSTGYLSREFHYLNVNHFQNKFKSIYNVGGMGHTSSLALGFSLNNEKKVICLDGDGSLLMHMGSLTTITSKKKNIKYILFNNNQHESVGSHKTVSNNINFKSFSKSIGFQKYFFSNNLKNFEKQFNLFIRSKKLSFFEIKFNSGTIENLTRPNNFTFLGKKFNN